MSTLSPADPDPSLASSGYMVSAQNGITSDDEVASLPSETTTDSELDELDSEFSDAEAEWRESIEQLELLLTMVLVPFVGKYLGRKCAYWGWNRFMEWKYPFESIIGNRAFAKRSGPAGTKASL
ncbi:hypothetical protein PHISP_06423 [Aspergillus sp. HF37]|nr:hypothetical protein PHISP_06423 [Aspergillus sp. HF37]